MVSDLTLLTVEWEQTTRSNLVRKQTTIISDEGGLAFPHSTETTISEWHN